MGRPFRQGIRLHVLLDTWRQSRERTAIPCGREPQHMLVFYRQKWDRPKGPTTEPLMNVLKVALKLGLSQCRLPSHPSRRLATCFNEDQVRDSGWTVLMYL
jgi:hypothetical protein